MGEVTIPLDKEEIEKLISKRIKEKSELFEISEEDYIIDYMKSTIKNEKLLTYLSTLKIKSSLKIDYSIPLVERMDLLSFYMDETKIVYNSTLISCIIAILLEEKGVEVDKDLWLTKSERKIFRQRWKQIIVTWTEFFDNFVPTLPLVNLFFKESIGKKLIESGLIEENEDHHFLGVNFIYVLLQENFIEFYQSLCSPKEKYKYFKVQMEQNIFGGKSLINILGTNNIPIFVYMAAMFNSCEGRPEFKDFFKESA